MEIFTGFLLLTFMGFLHLAHAQEYFPNIPVNSVQVQMHCGSTYGKNIHKLENEESPFWFHPSQRLSDTHYYAYIHFRRDNRFASIDALNPIFLQPSHVWNEPKAAYVRLGNQGYYHATEFERFVLADPNRGYRHQIFIRTPTGSMFMSPLKYHWNAATIMEGYPPIPNFMLEMYSRQTQANIA
ncbi:uncharacterized protein LOC117173331 [Belonocnema kinseyi]|uniref:uncharacterized protein LOC117173331 n=1 Tax=Belonocnema kinseyi TaxID=2817044 RepID=UPI00143D1CDE|nr:uncharacterized protein LOC117173331 [Belonocnema kinseyi]